MGEEVDKQNVRSEQKPAVSHQRNVCCTANFEQFRCRCRVGGARCSGSNGEGEEIASEERDLRVIRDQFGPLRDHGGPGSLWLFHRVTEEELR